MIDPERAAEAGRRLALKINKLPDNAVILSLLGQNENKDISLDRDGAAVLILARGKVAKELMAQIHKSSTRTDVERVKLKPKGEEPHVN